jgi:hypothetical protein
MNNINIWRVMEVHGGFLKWGYSQIMHFNRIFHSTQRWSSQELGFLLGSSHLVGINGIIRVDSLLARVITYLLSGMNQQVQYIKAPLTFKPPSHHFSPLARKISRFLNICNLRSTCYFAGVEVNDPKCGLVS